MACGILIALLMAGGQALPGTQPLETEGDLAARMVEGIDRYLMRELAASAAARPKAPSRERLRAIIGLVDERVPFDALALDVKRAHSPRIDRAFALTPV